MQVEKTTYHCELCGTRDNVYEIKKTAVRSDLQYMVCFCKECIKKIYDSVQ